MPDKNNSIKQIIDFRVEKLNKLRELGVDPAIIMKPFRQVEKDVDGNIAITERLIKRLANIK